jgi:DNA polymerase-3 subunit gamma/tau
MAAFGARYKIYIIDEVHMLSKNAFNALLKTLEEPPEHVKFLLATTEVNKVPVTVLSRCQRFDLRRIPSDKLGAHFAWVAEQEGVEAEPEALALIARAAEGSARDGLSILDQAIAHAGMEGGGVKADQVREMLGLSDRGAIRDLMRLILAADGPGALASLRRQYDYGVDPQSVLRALLEAVHGVTLVKLGTPPDAAQPAEEREAFAGWAAGLSFQALHRLWQLLLRGHDEVARAALPIEAGEMALLRVIHASSLPDPGELARQIASGSTPTIAPTAPPPRSDADAAAKTPESVGELVAYLERHGRHILAVQLQGVRLISFAPPEIVVSAARPIPADFVANLANEMRELTGRVWKVSTDGAAGDPSINEREAAAKDAARNAVLDHPIVKAAFEAFPDAELEGWPQPQRSTGL